MASRLYHATTQHTVSSSRPANRTMAGGGVSASLEVAAPLCGGVVLQHLLRLRLIDKDDCGLRCGSMQREQKLRNLSVLFAAQPMLAV